MITLRHRAHRVLTAFSIVGAAASLGGCGGGMEGVELNGKVFEALGVAGDGALGKKTEPKTQARAPLILPPDPNRLPEPGANANIQTGALQANPAWPVDRDAKRTADADAKKKAQDQYCKEDGNWKQRAHKDDIAAASGPNGSCQGSIFSVISDQLTGNKN
jgi:hypothetical protein